MIRFTHGSGVPSWRELAFTTAVGIVLVAVAFRLPGPLALGLVAAGSVAWCYFTVRFPVAGYLGSVLIQITVYPRLMIPLGTPGSGVAVGDGIWLGTFAGFVLLAFPRGIPTPRGGRYGLDVWAVWPYLAAATLLPILGVLGHGYPPAYALPGLRQLQWASYAPMAAFLCARYGSIRIAGAVIRLLLVAGIGNGIYGLAQFGFGMGWLGPFWIKPDLLYNAQQSTVRFFYPRATGLLVNPNSLGVYSALLLGIVLAFRPQKLPMISARWSAVATVVSILGLVLSGSRSALLGVLFMLALLIVLSGISRRIAVGGVVHSMALGLFLLALFPLVRDYLPDVIVARFGKLLDIARSGAEVDPTANARVVEWHMLWGQYLKEHIWGTWVPPSYALNSPVDSYYVFTAIQGTPLLTALWIAAMLGIALSGLKVYARSDLGVGRGFGLLLFMAVGVFLGSALGMSPMSEIQMITTLWVMVGVAYHFVHEPEAVSVDREAGRGVDGA